MEKTDDETFLRKVEKYKNERIVKIQKVIDEIDESLTYDELLLLVAEHRVVEDELREQIKEMSHKIEHLCQIALSGNDEHIKTIKESAKKAADFAEAAFFTGKKEQKRQTAIHAVSYRNDQQQKDGWIKHCHKAKESTASISTLDDLLDIPGYHPLVTKIARRTLKTWANEAGIVFKAGRPKK